MNDGMRMDIKHNPYYSPLLEMKEQMRVTMKEYGNERVLFDNKVYEKHYQPKLNDVVVSFTSVDSFDEIKSKYDHIDLLMFDCVGKEASIFSDHHKEYIKTKVKHIAGIWYIVDVKDAVQNFIKFKKEYLTADSTFRVYERNGKDVTYEILSDDYIRNFNSWYSSDQAWKPYGQLFVYITTGEKNNFRISPNQNRRLWIVDDFYEDPMSVREFALKQKYHEGGFGRGYIGRRTEQQFLFPGLKEKFEEIIGRKITLWEDHGMNGRFQVAWAGEALVYHCDDQRWAGMLYLTPDAPFECGTTLYAHRKTGIRHNSHPEILSTFKPESTLDRTPYQPVDVAGNVFNRLVIFDAGCIHSASEYFGFNMANARLWQMFFFD